MKSFVNVVIMFVMVGSVVNEMLDVINFGLLLFCVVIILNMEIILVMVLSKLSIG